jgi:hypothetical protein
MAYNVKIARNLEEKNRIIHSFLGNYYSRIRCFGTRCQFVNVADQYLKERDWKRMRKISLKL